MNINKDIKITARQFENFETPIAGLQERDGIGGSFNQHTYEYFVIVNEHGESIVNVSDWIVEFWAPDGTLFTRFVVTDAKYKILFGE